MGQISQTNQASTFSVLKILWGAMLISFPIYAFVAFQFRTTGTSTDSPMLPFSIAAVALAGGSVLIRMLLLSPARILEFLRKPCSLEELAMDSQTKAINQERLDKLKSLSKEQVLVERLNRYLFLPYLLSFVLAEGVAIIGLVLAQLSGSPETFLPFGIGGAVCLLLAFPRPEWIFLNLKSYSDFLVLS